MDIATTKMMTPKEPVRAQGEVHTVAGDTDRQVIMATALENLDGEVCSDTVAVAV